MPQLLWTQTAQALPATQTIRSTQKHTPQLRTSIRKMILLVEQPINHEHAYPILYCNQSEDYFQRQQIPAKFSTISATINITHRQIIKPLKVHLRTLFSKSLSYVYQLHQAPSGPVYTRKIPLAFRIYNDCLI